MPAAELLLRPLPNTCWLRPAELLGGEYLGTRDAPAACERLRIVTTHAAELGANAIIGVRYDATELMNGVSEVLCYGTAVIAELSSGTA
jgi:uncharacterized protein YbjQ (UPF0145 family)